MGSRGLKRATLLLIGSSIILALFINNTALECGGGGRLRDGSTLPGPPSAANRHSRAFLPSLQDTQDRTSTSSDRSEIVQRFVKAMSRRGPVEPSCRQATSEYLTHSVSMLGIGSLDLELGPGSQILDLLRGIVRTLPASVDITAWTLTKPLPLDTNTSTLEALRGLGTRGLGVVSLANELIYSEEDEVRTTTCHLNEAGLHWVGLSVRKEDLVSVNGLRISILAYCAVYEECEDSGALFSPVKYSPRTAATAVKSLKSRGADVIVVMVRWGRGGSYLPDETVLATARYLASLGVTLIIGDHPVLQQGHAYFEETLVIFSPGSFSRSSASPHLCWQQGEDGRLEYSQAERCQSVHPNLRRTLLASQQQTSLYQILLSRSLPPVARYVSLPRSRGGSGLQLPRPPASESLSWIRVCGEQDLHCLACHSM